MKAFGILILRKTGIAYRYSKQPFGILILTMFNMVSLNYNSPSLPYFRMGRSERSSEENEHPQESSSSLDTESERSNPVTRQKFAKEKSSRSLPLRPAISFLENYTGNNPVPGPSYSSLTPILSASTGTTAFNPADVNPTLKGASKANPAKGQQGSWSLRYVPTS